MTMKEVRAAALAQKLTEGEFEYEITLETENNDEFQIWLETSTGAEDGLCVASGQDLKAVHMEAAVWLYQALQKVLAGLPQTPAPDNSPLACDIDDD